MYLGPMKATLDEEGCLYPRGVPVEVSLETAAKLATAPYAENFVVVNSQGSAFVVTEDKTCCDSSDECC